MRPVFHYPFNGMYPVSSPYGPRDNGFHTGVDFGVPQGVAILASNDGTVIYTAYEAGGAGNTVTISGSDGWQSRYHHLLNYIVGVGEVVRAGQTVGFCDSTGASTGPHLHFEIRPTPTTTTDPIPILQADANQPSPIPDPTPATIDEDDAMLIFNTDTKDIAIIFGSHRPRKIVSVNDYHGGAVLSIPNDAWQQYWDDAIAIYNKAV